MFKLRHVLSLASACCLFLVLPAVSATTLPPTQLTGALHWRSVGPFVGGRATVVAGVPGEPQKYYMGTASGGVWETTDAGATWKNISEKDFDTGNIGALAVAPSNPQIIYVGTGDSAPRNTIMTAEGGTGGVYKSSDGGKTWTRVGLENTNSITWIVVDPNNPAVVYVAALGHLWAPNAERGVYKSTDGGQTWKKILYVNDNTGAITLAMDPQNPQVVYASMWYMTRTPWTFVSGGQGGGIFKTTDGGAHWTDISRNPGLPKGVLGKIGVAVAPSNPNVVYALIQADYKPGHPGGLFRSENGGQSWTLMNDSLDITQRAFYYMRVYVDPKDANTIYLPNVQIWESHDGGKKLAVMRVNGGDNHTIWVNPQNPDFMIEGNDGGATVTLNGGKSWSTEDNQPTGQFYHVNLDNQFPFWIYGSQQDSGTSAGPSAVRQGSIPPVWTRVQGGEESWIVPQPGSPWMTYGQSYFGRFYREDRRTDAVRAISPWPTYKFGSADAQVKYRYGWIHGPIVFAPGNPNELLVGANVVFESNDQGIHWKAISPDLTRNDKSKQQRPGGPISADVTSEESYDTISSLAVSPLNENVIWTGSDDGLVYVTTDAGGHWNAARPSSLPDWAIITSIEASHTDAGTAWLTASRYMWDDPQPFVYKTTDYGKHWTALINGVPGNEYAESVRQDPSDPDLMFLATSKTVYFSLDGGSQWLPLTLNLPAVRVEDIAIQPEQHAVVLATFGRGFWVLDNLQFLEQLSTAQVDSDAPYLFKPQQTWLVKRSTFGFGRGAVGGENLPAGATVFYHLPANYDGHTPVKLSFTTADGQPVNSYTLPQTSTQPGSEFGPAPHKAAAKLHAGMNRFEWNLRYTDATDIKGIFHSGFGVMVPVGPEIVPGTYYVTLSYGGQTEEQPFVVKLDPRLTTTAEELQTQFNLLTQINTAISNLDAAINQATAARSAVEQAATSGKLSAARADKMVATLNKDVDAVVNFQIQSGEGGLVFRPKLRSWLGSLFQRISMDYVAPTPSQQQVAAMYIGEANTAIARLQADAGSAKALLNH